MKEVGPIATSVIAINDIIEQQNYRQKISAAGESGKNRLSNLGWFRTFLLKKATGMSDEEIAKTGHILGCANGIYELLMAASPQGRGTENAGTVNQNCKNHQ